MGTIIRSLVFTIQYRIISLSQSCPDVEKEERVSERGAPNVIARFFETTSRVSPSLQFVDLPEEEG